MRRTIAATLAGVAVVAACSEYDEAERPSATPSAEGGAPPALGDAGQAPLDGANPVTSECPSDAPVASFRSDFAAGFGDATTAVQGGATIVMADTGGVPVLRVTGTPPAGVGNALRATKQWSWPAVRTRTVRAAFDYRAAYTGKKVYADIGCSVGLEMGETRLSVVTLSSDQTTNAPLTWLGGRHPVGNSSATESFRLEPNLTVNALDATLRRVSIDIHIDVEAAVSKVTGTVDGQTVVGTFRTPAPLTRLWLRCGIIYADTSDEGELTTEIGNVSIVACP